METEMSGTAQIDGEDDEIEFIDREVDDEEVEKQGAAAKPRSTDEPVMGG